MIQWLIAAVALLGWDQETYMPSGGAAARAAQLATLEKLAHARLTDGTIEALLPSLEKEALDWDPASVDAALVRVTRRDLDQAVKLPSKLVAAFAETSALALHAWHLQSLNLHKE